MHEKKIKSIVEQFTLEIKKKYGIALCHVILYGSCARGDFSNDSDIDILILLNLPPEELGKARKQIAHIADQIDLNYDVVLAPVVQNDELFRQYMPVSVFYQNIQREGIKIA